MGYDHDDGNMHTIMIVMKWNNDNTSQASKCLTLCDPIKIHVLRLRNVETPSEPKQASLLHFIQGRN
jgi:hypothetical protein